MLTGFSVSKYKYESQFGTILARRRAVRLCEFYLQKK